MPITILRLGAPSAETCARLGGYEDWIALNLTTATRSIDIIGGEAPPTHADCRGVILTGSVHMVGERLPWSEALRPWLQEAVARELPVFAICYGHQLLADALGGTVGANPNGAEIGNITLNRLPACDDDPLFAPLPATFSAKASCSCRPARCRWLPTRTTRTTPTASAKTPGASNSTPNLPKKACARASRRTVRTSPMPMR